MNAEGVTVTERDIIIKLLELYKDFPCLWDLSNKDYCNKDARNQAYSIMLDVLKKLDSAATIKTLKNKLDNMRTSYKRERKKVEASKTSGAGNDEVHVPSLWYYEHLSFLDEKTTPTTEVIDNMNSSLSNNDEEPATKRERVARKKQNDILKKQSELLESAKLLISSEGTSADAFGNSVSSQLKELPKVQRCLAEKLIGEVLFYAKLEVLTFQTSINVKRSSEQYFSQRYAYQQQVPQLSPFQPSPTPSPQHRQPSPYQPSPSPEHHQPSPYSPSSPQHRQPSPYQPSPTPSPQHRQPSPQHHQPSTYQPSPQHRQPSPSPKHSHTLQSLPSPQHCQPSLSPLPQLPPPSYQHIVFPQPASDDPSSQPFYLLDLPPVQSGSSSLINDYPNTSFELSSNQQQVFRGKAKELNKYLIFKK